VILVLVVDFDGDAGEEETNAVGIVVDDDDGMDERRQGQIERLTESQTRSAVAGIELDTR
jgi:hypothetical protein